MLGIKFFFGMSTWNGWSIHKGNSYSQSVACQCSISDLLKSLISQRTAENCGEINLLAHYKYQLCKSLSYYF